MSDEPTLEVAAQVLDSMGIGAALLVSMRIVLLVGERTSDGNEMLDAAKEAIAAIKRVGALAGAFELS